MEFLDNKKAFDVRRSKKITYVVASLSCVAFLGGCAGAKVSVVPIPYPISQTCVIDNPRVTVPQFHDMILDSLTDNGVRYSVVNQRSNQCDYNLDYTALRSWDFATFIANAKVNVRDKNNKVVGSIDYVRPNNFNLGKWSSNNDTIKLLMDEMLINQKNIPSQNPVTAKEQTTQQPRSNTVAVEQSTITPMQYTQKCKDRIDTLLSNQSMDLVSINSVQNDGKGAIYRFSAKHKLNNDVKNYTLRCEY